MHSERSWPACPRTHPCPWPVRRGRFLRLWYRDTITTAEQSEPDARKQIVNTTETVLDRKFGLTNTKILAILDRQRACNFDTKITTCVKMSDLDRTSTTLDQCSPRNRNVRFGNISSVCTYACMHVRIHGLEMPYKCVVSR